jgi:hypothetical protein
VAFGAAASRSCSFPLPNLRGSPSETWRAVGFGLRAVIFGPPFRGFLRSGGQRSTLREDRRAAAMTGIMVPCDGMEKPGFDNGSHESVLSSDSDCALPRNSVLDSAEAVERRFVRRF